MRTVLTAAGDNPSSESILAGLDGLTSFLLGNPEASLTPRRWGAGAPARIWEFDQDARYSCPLDDRHRRGRLAHLGRPRRGGPRSTRPARPGVSAAELPGVAEEEISLRQGLALGGGAFTFIVLLLLNSLDELESAAMTVLGPDIGRRSASATASSCSSRRPPRRSSCSA